MKLTPQEGRWLLDMLEMQEEQLSAAGPEMMEDRTTDDQFKQEVAESTFVQLGHLDSIREKVNNDRRRRERTARTLRSLLQRVQGHAG